MHLLAERFLFGSEGFASLREEVKIYLLAQMSPLHSPIFFYVVTSIVYGPLSIGLIGIPTACTFLVAATSPLLLIDW
jgi:hypothetical protein